MSLLKKRLKKNIINKEIDKTIESLTTKEQQERKEKQSVKLMSLNEYVKALTSDNFKNFVENDIKNRIEQLSGSPKEMSKRMNDFVLILELFQNLKKEISLANITIKNKQIYNSLISEKQEQVLKLTNDILEYRRLVSLEQEFINKQVVDIALRNIQEKHLNFITSEDTSTIESNLKVILNEIHIVLVDQLYKEENAIIQYQKINNKRVRFIKYPHPNILWDFTNIDVNLDNAESQIHNISQYMQLLAELKDNITNMVNAKRIGKLTRNDKIEKFDKSTFEKIKQNLLNVVDSSMKKFLNVLFNPYFELIKNQNIYVVNYFDNPYIKSGDDMVFVYDLIHEFSALLRDTKNTKGMVFLFENMYQMMIDNIELFGGQAGRLERVKMINWISQIEEKYQVDYYKMKNKLAIDQVIHRIVLEKKNKTLKEITLADILESMPLPKKVDQSKEVRSIIKNLKKDNWYSLRKQILTITWNSRKSELPLSWYKTIANPSYLDYMIVQFTGFFQQYQHLYGTYPYDLSKDSIMKFREWQRKRIDNGKFLNAWVRHYIDLNKKNFLLFNKETGLLDVDMNRARFSIETMGKEVRETYDNAIKLLEKAKGNTEINMSIKKCRHEEIDDEIRELIKLEGTEEQIKQLEEEKESCQVQADDATVCTLCGIRLDVILDSAPESFDEMERRRLNDQAEQMEIGYQELQRQELEKKLISLVDDYMKKIIQKTNVSVQTVVSNLTESNNISRQEVDKIKRELVMIIMSNDRNIFNSVQSVYQKNLTTEVDVQSIKFQIMNDLAKMLLIIYFTRKFPNITDGTPKGIQKMFNNIDSIQTSVNPELYKFEFRLNYSIKIYNQAVGIYNNSEPDQLEEDDTEILESNLNSLQGNELEIVTASFGIDQRSQEDMIREIKQKKDEQKEHTVKESDELVQKMVAFTLNIYEERLQKTFTLSTSLYDDVDTTLFAAIVAQQLGRITNQQLKFNEYRDLFLNLFYWSRIENENNPAFEEYKNTVKRIYHQDISNVQLLKQQRILFIDRSKQVKQLSRFLKALVDLTKIDLNDIDMKYMYINKNAFIKGKRSEIHLDPQFILNISALLNQGNISLVLLNGLLNDKTFKSKITNLKQYQEEFKTKLEKVNAEMKELVKIEELHKQYNQTEFLCPVCPYSSSLNIDLVLHVRASHNFHVSQKLEIISPMGKKCPYCPFKGAKVYEHIKTIHLQLKNAKHLYEMGMENRYKSHLRILWEKHGIGQSTERKMKNLDNRINMLELYQEYCDQNTENNLKRHNFINNICTYCKRTFANITNDGMNNKTAERHAQQMKDYVEMLNNRYCLSNNFRKIHENTECSVKDLTSLIPIQDQWHLLRQTKSIQKVIVDSVIRKVDLYKQSLNELYKRVKPDGDFKNEKLDIIDQLNNVVNKGLDFVEPYDGLNALYSKYNLNDKTIKNIFKTNDITKWDKILLKINDSSGNETIREGKQKIKELVVKNIKLWLENNKGDIKDFENLVGKKLPIKEMEKYDSESIKELKGDRTKRLIKVVRNVILNLSKLNKGILNPYVQNSYLLSWKKNQQRGGFDGSQFKGVLLQAPLDLYVGGKFDGSQFKGVLLQAPLDLYKGGKDLYHGLPVTNVQVYEQGPEITKIDGLVGGNDIRGNDVYRGLIVVPQYVYKTIEPQTGGDIIVQEGLNIFGGSCNIPEITDVRGNDVNVLSDIRDNPFNQEGGNSFEIDILFNRLRNLRNRGMNVQALENELEEAELNDDQLAISSIANRIESLENPNEEQENRRLSGFADMIREQIYTQIRDGNEDFVRMVLDDEDEMENINDFFKVAVESNQVDIAKLLLDNGANVNQPYGIEQDTALHIAALNENSDMIEMLMENGANPNIRNRDDNRPEDLTDNQELKDLFVTFELSERIPLKQNPTEQCHEDVNIISQEDWKNEDLTNLIYIKWPTRTDCYLADDLMDYIKTNEPMIKWRKNQEGRTINNTTGRGYEPDPESNEKYISLYPVRNWVTIKSLKKMIKSKERNFIAVKDGKARLGNQQGSFGVSQKHAQEEEQLWKIIEEKKFKDESSSSSESDDDVEFNLGPITSTTQIGGCTDVCTI